MAYVIRNLSVIYIREYRACKLCENMCANMLEIKIENTIRGTGRTEC